MAYLNQKTRIELPEKWAEHVSRARQRPNSFNVIECSQDAFKNWTTFLNQFTEAIVLFPLDLCVNVEYRKNINASCFTKILIIVINSINEEEFKLPGLAYKDKRPISTAEYYDQFPHAANIEDATVN
ncbi:hypothetical protein WA026_017141 [Henosepilachna vigintioctopunctata]|uniref:Uncharacterized protein n=1 Tax=Henosepilachna vigintioctopunctata TaxID=420089 RepID=A0AAW1TXB2_9CUCU